jgi:hypothetical protein
MQFKDKIFIIKHSYDNQTDPVSTRTYFTRIIAEIIACGDAILKQTLTK